MKYRTSTGGEAPRRKPLVRPQPRQNQQSQQVQQPWPQASSARPTLDRKQKVQSKDAQLEAKMAALAQVQQRNEAIIELSPDRPTADELFKKLFKSAQRGYVLFTTRVFPGVKRLTARATSPKARTRYKSLAKDRRVQIGAGVAAVALILTVLISSLSRVTGDEIAGVQTDSDGNVLPTGQVQGSQTEIVEPTFDVVQPEGVSADTDSIRFDPTKQTASLPVSIGGVQATLSQQKLDEESLRQEAFLLTVAQSFGLGLQFPTDKGDMYIGSNSQQSVTTVTFLHDGFLFFIRGGLLDEQEVIRFINNLQ